MAKFLFFSDLHCHPHAAFATTLPNGRNSRLQDCLNIIAQAKQVAIEHRCEAVIFCGDLFHSRTKIDVDVFTATWLAVQDLAKSVQTILMKGNHDCHNKVGDVHSLEPFRPICTVIDKPYGYQLHGCFFYFAPYTPEPQTIVEHLKNNTNSYEVVCLHQAMREGAVGPYGHTGHGELSVADLPLDNLKYVFAGDYHKRQWINDKVHYIGSPLQLTFGEEGEFKAFTLLDTSTWKTQDIPTNAPRFLTFEHPDQFMEARNRGEVRPEIDFVRVLYDESTRGCADILKGACDRIQIVEESQQKEALQRIGNEVASSDMLLLEAYIDQKGGALDREKLLSVGLSELWGDE